MKVMAYRRDYGDFPGERGSALKDIATKSLYIQSKKFYIDIKESRKGKFMKLSEVAPNGQKMRIIMDLTTAKEFNDRISEFCEAYSSLGPSGPQSGYYTNDSNIKSETIFREDRRYYLDLKQNHRGRFLKVSMSLPTHERSQIVIPAHGMIDIRDALSDLLNEHGKEEKSEVPPGEKRLTMQIDNGRNFYFDVITNARGSYLRLTEVSGSFKTTITIPEDAWDGFMSAVEEATESPVTQEDNIDDLLTA